MDIFIILTIIILFFACIALCIRLILLKMNIRNITGELKKTRDADYDRQITVALIDRDMTAMAVELNRNLDHQKSLKLKEEAARKQLEMSVSDIAHDLRTPLTVVKGNLQMLESEKLSAEGRQCLNVSRRKAESLKAMVDEFFELSVIESDGEMAKLTKTDIVDHLAGFLIDHENMIRDKGLTPDIDFPDRAVFVMMNSEMSSRVFSNLLTNICRYAKGGFYIRIAEEVGINTAAADTGADRIYVVIGNRVETKDDIDTERIFDRSYRADKARRSGSAGLGLYIAKLLMEKQQGSVSAAIIGDRLEFTLAFLKA